MVVVVPRFKVPVPSLTRCEWAVPAPSTANQRRTSVSRHKTGRNRGRRSGHEGPDNPPLKRCASSPARLPGLAHGRLGPPLRGAVPLFYPVTDAGFNTASYRQFADGPWLTRKAMQWFWNAYAPDAATRKQVLASPLRAGLNQLKGLPKALVITDEADVLRDEGEAYAAKLRAAGNDVTAVRHEGTIHDFAMLNALAKTNAAQAAVEQVGGFLRTVLRSGS